WLEHRKSEDCCKSGSPFLRRDAGKNTFTYSIFCLISQDVHIIHGKFSQSRAIILQENLAGKLQVDKYKLQYAG
ncbi:MAG: hypothetical protein K2O71_04195, partial [Lachnospiraceae bacterium]|nr:hypothetical protein [Lachnospiraceae bacterium]